MAHKLILGSTSPRRRELLATLGLTFEVMSPGVEEVLYVSDPVRTVRVNAEAKYQGLLSRVTGPVWLLTADTVVFFEGTCFLKPDDRDEAIGWFRRFSGSQQRVYTGISFGPVDSPPVTIHEVSTVWFRRLSDQDIDNYFRAVNPLDKAGGYDINERGDLIIDRCEGSRSNVMGLPLERIQIQLKEAGLL